MNFPLRLSDENKTACAYAKPLSHSRMNYHDKIVALDLPNAARNRRQLIAAGSEGNLKSKLSVDEFDWAFE